MTKKQKMEIDCLRYFQLELKNYTFEQNIAFLFLDQKGKTIQVIETRKGVSPEEAYFEITDQGKKNISVRSKKKLAQLLDAKKWRLRQIDFWEQGNLDGTFPYIDLIKHDNGRRLKKHIVEFIAKTMFKGIDYALIMNLYQKEFENSLNNSTDQKKP